MELPASVEGHERLRLFVGLPVPRDDAAALSRWLEAIDVRDARRVRPEYLHFTLAFLGHRPRGELETLAGVLDELAGRSRPFFPVERYRETRSVGMLVCRDEDGRGAALAEHLHRRLEEAGVYRREERPWLPHVTVLRFRKRPGLRPELPNIRSITPSDAAAYLSVLRPGGAQYEIVHRVHLQ
jgi:2'-5' RNA ligase